MTERKATARARTTARATRATRARSTAKTNAGILRCAQDDGENLARARSGTIATTTENATTQAEAPAGAGAL
jgi:hypothetical protein